MLLVKVTKRLNFWVCLLAINFFALITIQGTLLSLRSITINKDVGYELTLDWHDLESSELLQILEANQIKPLSLLLNYIDDLPILTIDKGALCADGINYPFFINDTFSERKGIECQSVYDKSVALVDFYQLLEAIDSSERGKSVTMLDEGNLHLKSTMTLGFGEGFLIVHYTRQFSCIANTQCGI